MITAPQFIATALRPAIMLKTALRVCPVHDG
jgi:hypothetical protein